MCPTNAEISAALDQVADLLEIEGANPFRIRAYRNAAYTIAHHPTSLAEAIEHHDDLTALPGIGQDIATKIQQMVATGSLPLLDELQQRYPLELTDLLQISGLGPRRIKRLFDELNVRTLTDLKRVLDAGQVRELSGFGPRSEQQIRHSVESRLRKKPRIPLGEVEDIAQQMRQHLQAAVPAAEVVIAGSYRRRRDTVGDLDIVVATAESAAVMVAFTGYPKVAEVVAKGRTRATVRLRSGLQVDLRVVEHQAFGAALHYLTGSRSHSIALRQIAADRGLKLNEYGIWQGGRLLAGADEAEIYTALGLPWIPPELRENRGEIEAARQGCLPHLLTLSEIRGDLHLHTLESDGRDSLQAMIMKARQLGYEYIAVTDHSPRLRIAHGMTPERLQGQLRLIDAANEALGEQFVLKGCEVDILEDGRLDLPDALLQQLDLTVCSVHSRFDLPEQKQTARILRAMDNPGFSILGHPTGRLLGRRAPYAVDLKELLKAACERGCFVELDGHPQRLDLMDLHCRLAREHNVKVSISTDAHSVADLDFMHFGVDQARRGWLESKDVLNTLPRRELLALLKARR